ncbi:Uncharacterised protein [Mycobacterium tuberculosis]|uniref:Uncharacterized protein n=1 Tax=Mycobacterium tuberculosis TaxID=1773 RepID=A0A654TVB3_MYCTX|nr:Uncharacterised protein [Mycobacterium tuberculosis]CKV05333.1 Uncharacterised protein [Mycobacterium tuberculosis]CNM81001.1 Uncharacterised protein [Mycobacterium tuberculosis]COY60692.1 Uncharacterised protein [Mycobacterium tuberculosis]COZ90097.1 Uncharacterised protein [Mycobacterium tuberculosis]
MCRPRVTTSSTATVSMPDSGLDGPNTCAPAHAIAAASAPSAAPTTGSAVIGPRPIGVVAEPGVGITVANAKAVASERITVRLPGVRSGRHRRRTGWTRRPR